MSLKKGIHSDIVQKADEEKQFGKSTGTKESLSRKLSTNKADMYESTIGKEARMAYRCENCGTIVLGLHHVAGK